MDSGTFDSLAEPAERVVVMAEFDLMVHFARRVPDPIFRGAERHIFFVDVTNMPEGLPKDANPRNQRIDRGIWKDIRKHLLNQEGTPNTFHLKNKGMSVLARRVERVTDDQYRIEISEGQGIVDGGHTYDLICDCKAEIDDANAAGGAIQQFVKVEVFVGIPDQVVSEVAGGLNTAVQVQEFSLENLKGHFDWIKAALAGKSYEGQIAYKENEQKAFDARDIVALLHMFNVEAFPHNQSNDPVSAYVSKGAVLDHYMDHVDQYKALAPILPDILELHDRVAYGARGLHTEAGGRGGKLVFVDKRERGKFSFPFIGQESDYRLHKAALFPMLAAFRWMVELDPESKMARWKGGFSSVIELWERVAAELMQATQTTSNELARNVPAIGRTRSHWSNLRSLVTMRQLMQAQQGPAATV